MASAGPESKPPAKFDDWVVGDEFINLFHTNKGDSPFETPTVHCQIDGNVNNVTLRTPSNKIEFWKKVILDFFSTTNHQH